MSNANSRRSKAKKPEPVLITCVGKCKKTRREMYFYKVDSPLFPSGNINICRDCIREQVKDDDMDSVITFLRQIDKPFNEKVWNEALQHKNNTIGEYIRKINSLQQLKGKTFNDSDGMQLGKTVDVISPKVAESVANVKGEVIDYSDELASFWGIGYKKHEYLQMEKFYQDMRLTHEIHTPIHVDLLRQLSYMSVERDRLRQAGDWTNYTKVSKTIEDMTKSAGFRPVDRRGIDDMTGIKSFSQIFEEVEKRGFRKPPPLEFDEDIVDAMIVSLANYYHRLVGKQILAEIPEEIKQELGSFYEDDLTPVEIDDNEYEDMDFSVDDDEDDV